MSQAGIQIRKRLFIFALLLSMVSWGGGAKLMAQGRPGAVYVMTNQTTGNAVTVFSRAANGALTVAGTFSTGGLGFGTGGDPLGSQGALVLSHDHHLLFAANAGSNDLSVFEVRKSSLRLVTTVSSGGTQPVSLTVHKDLLYVLNVGGTPNITGFVVSPEGMLTMLPGSSRPLAGGTSAAPAEVAFSPDGSFLAVTEKGTNLIDTYEVEDDGLTTGPVSNPSNGVTPFGFAFNRAGILIVSEAFGGASGQGAMSSYSLAADGSLTVVSGTVPDTQTAPCWVVIANHDRVAFTSNTGSNSVSGYSVASGGTLTLLNATSGATSAGPIDMALTDNGQFLYVLSSAAGALNAFRVQADGSLTALAGASGLPSGSQGIAAR